MAAVDDFFGSRWRVNYTPYDEGKYQLGLDVGDGFMAGAGAVESGAGVAAVASGAITLGGAGALAVTGLGSPAAHQQHDQQNAL